MPSSLEEKEEEDDEQQQQESTKSAAVAASPNDEAAVEAWLEGHPEFFEDYFYRKASRKLVDTWMYRRARTTTTVSSVSASFGSFDWNSSDLLALSQHQHQHQHQHQQQQFNNSELPIQEEEPEKGSAMGGGASGGGSGSGGGGGCGGRGSGVSRSTSCSSSAIRKVSSEFAYLDRNLTSSPLLTKFNDGSASFIVDTPSPRAFAFPAAPMMVDSPAGPASAPASASTVREARPASLSGGGLQQAFAEEGMMRELVLDIFHELDVTPLCHKILRNVCLLIGADRCSLFLVESAPGGHLELVSNLFDVTADSCLEVTLANHSSIRIPIGQGIVGSVALTGEPARIADAYQDSRFNAEIDKRTGYRTHSVLSLPVKDHTGAVFGVTQAVNKKNGGIFSETDEKTFETFLTFCGIGIRNAKLYKQSQLETKRNQVLLDMVRLISEQQDNLDPLVRKIMHYMQLITTCRWCQILLIDDPTSSEGMFDRVYELRTEDSDESQASAAPVVTDKCRLLINSEIVHLVCDTGEPLNITNPVEDNRLTELERLSITALLCLPIKNAQSHVAGLCLLMNKADGGAFSAGDQQLAEAFALFCGLGIHNTRMFERAELAKRRQRVALDVLSYHAVAACDDAQKLARCLVPSARYLGINDFAFSDLAMTDEDTVISVIKMFEDTGLFCAYKLDYGSFCRWILSVKKNYRAVTYHNWRHALNVTQCMFAMLRTSPQLRSLSRLDKLALLIASICHDLDHRGTDNKFQQLTLSPLAQLYSSSMLERHHFNQCIMLLSINGCDILSALSQTQYERCIGTIEKCILATDLQRHMVARKSLQQLTSGSGDGSSGEFKWSDQSHHDLLLGLLMTAADLSAITKPWTVQKKVAQLVASEFYEQGDREKQELHLQPDDLKDREKQQQLPAMQVGFIDFVCLPAYTLLCDLCHDLHELRDGCLSNRAQWQALTKN